jgi:hypothetical protein
MTLSRRLKALEEKTKPATPVPGKHYLPLSREELRETLGDLAELGVVRITRDGEPVDILEAQLDGGLDQIVERMSAAIPRQDAQDAPSSA